MSEENAELAVGCSTSAVDGISESTSNAFTTTSRSALTLGTSRGSVRRQR
jgi:hypothetical protein